MPIMRNLITTLLLLSSLFCNAQIHWQHSGGPIGATGGELHSDSTTAYYTGQYFLYRTTDGENWQPIYDRYLSYFSFYGDTLVGLLKNYYDENEPSDSIAISLDGGDTWNELPLPGDNIYIHNFVATKLGVFLDLGDLEWPSYKYFIWRLADNGFDWEKFYTPDAAYELFSSEGEFYFSMFEGQFGQTNFYHVLDLQTFDTLGLMFDDNVPQHYSSFYAHGHFMSILKNEISLGQDQFYWSLNSGLTWALMDTLQFGRYVRFTTLGDKIYMLGSDNRLLVSSDEGQSWNPFTPGTPVTGYRGLAAAGGKLLTNNYDAVIISIDASTGHVAQANNHMPEAYTADLDYSSGKLWAASANGLFTYDLADQAWYQLTSHYTLGRKNSFEYVDANELGFIMTARSYNSKEFDISLDDGMTWTTHHFPWMDSSAQNWHLEKMGFIGDIIYVSTNHKRAYRSADFGETWNEVTTLGEPINSAVLYWNGYHVINTDDEIFVSSDEGNTWEHFADFTLGILDRLIAVDDILLGFVETSQSSPHQRIYISTDGINWQWAHDGLPGVSAYKNVDGADNLRIASDLFSSDGNYFLHLGYGGLFATSDTFKVWFPLNLSFDNNYELADSIFFYGYYGGLRKALIPQLYGELVSGVVYFDKNDNGVQDTGEDALSNVHVSLIDPYAINPYYGTITDDEGIYKLGMNLDSEDTLRCNFRSRYLRHINPTNYLITSGATDLHFGVVMEADKTDYSLRSNSGIYRPGFDTNIHLAYKNEGTTVTESNLSLQLDPKLEFLQSDPIPDLIQGDTLVWYFGELPVLGTGGIRLTVHVPSSVLPGEVIRSSATIQPSGNEETPWDNTTIMTNGTFGSYDPNDKLISPEKGLTIQNIKDGYEIFYTIRFQNTGNYPADRVRIIDPIDTTLILNSVRIVSSSHQISGCRILPSQERLMEITFDHIMLPDSSSDYAGSQGYVTFAAQRRKDLKLTVPTKNQARIYFDFNDPIYTNNQSWYPQAEIISSTEDPVHPEDELIIKPNPANHFITVSVKEGLSGSGTIYLINADGKIAQQQPVSAIENAISLDIAKLSPGVYVLQLVMEEQNLSGKVVIH